MSEITNTTFTRNDPEYFEVYCPKHYDRHTYRLVFKNDESVEYKEYATAKYEWYTHKAHVKYIEVLDKSGKGF